MWEKEKLLVTTISPFPTVLSKDLYCKHVKTRACLGRVKAVINSITCTCQPFPKRQISDYSKLQEFPDNNFKFNANSRKFSKMGRKYCGKRRYCSLRAISPLPTVFSKDLYCKRVKTRACLGKG